MIELDFAKIENKWQDKWEKERVFGAIESKKKKFYVLEMFPYPSAAGLHMGHAFNFVIGDVFARFKKMQGFNVLHPMGFDSLGLPAENAAIKAKTHPEEYTNNSIKNFIKQQKTLGLTYDWTRQVNTADPDYYKWDQWIFLKMFEKGLVYEKEAPVNWCPKCNTILANEQVQGGKCWRHEDTEVEIKNVRQLFLKITDYADRLLEGHKNLKWPEKTIAMQKNWIGKSYGTEIDFEIENPDVKNKISNVVIVHGANESEKGAFEGGRENTRHWFPWLREELRKRNINFSSELYPKDWNPDYQEWKKIFEKNKIDENTILIGHSLGCGFLARWISEKKKKVRKIILVAPYILDSPEMPGLKGMVDFNLIDIKNYCEELSVFYSDNDFPDILKSVKYLKQKIRGKFREFKGTGHFCKRDGFEQFPELLNEISSTQTWPIFTTRADTIFGVTFMVVSAQHQRLMELVTKEQKSEVEKFLKKIKSVSEKELESLEKDGVFTGSYAINPATGKKIPIWAANFVIADYGSGMVMADAHDQRDLEFAQKYKINLIETILPEDGKSTDPNKSSRAFTDYGTLVNSGEFSGLKSKEAIDKISTWLEKQGKARKVVNYKLRDWSIARQRYWGTPIPLIHCEKCGLVPVPEKDLPVKLPKEVTFGEGNPLLTNDKWLNVKCPKCDGKAQREANTMDTFVNSSWYFFRYCDPQNKKEIFAKEKANYWMPVDLYIGGAEHACMHLIYCRFYTMFLHDLGLINFEEPAPRLFHQGMINDEKGEKMSKSKGNVVEPLETMAKYGVDTTRFYLLSEASPDKGFNWTDSGIQGSLRIINKIWNISENIKFGKDSEELTKKLNQTIKNVSEQIENIDYRKSTIEIRALFDFISQQKEISKESFGKAVRILAPFCPHIAEELWEKLGNKGFISAAEWPKYEEIKEKKSSADVSAKIIENTKPVIEKLSQTQKISKVYLYVMPFEIKQVDKKKIEKELGKPVEIFAVNDPNKIDPENKSKKSLPGKPGIYLE
ncbi:Isoleucine--tRNA ligase [uncultured archaeon]|nr:Isoleucine--tRNA ligase [uncultured archaeon]